MDECYWLVPQTLAGCPKPGGDDATTLDADLAWLAAQGIHAFISLTAEPLPPEALARHGLTALHLPVIDFHAPELVQLQTAVSFIDQHQAQRQAVAVHCRMGIGRTGTVLAAYLIAHGADLATAIAQVRAVRPGAVETPGQMLALAEFANRREQG